MCVLAYSFGYPGYGYDSSTTGSDDYYPGLEARAHTDIHIHEHVHVAFANSPKMH